MSAPEVKVTQALIETVAEIIKETAADFEGPARLLYVEIAEAVIPAISQSAQAETLAVLEQARRAIEMQRSYGCGRCNGDCGSANPPVLACPMQVAQETLTALTAKIKELKNE